MNREYHKWYSDRVHREMELLIFGHGGRPVLFFPTRMARFYDYENWGIVDAVRDKINNGEIQLFCVDSIDAVSFYNIKIPPAERIKRHSEYEQYILNEVIRFIYLKNGADRLEVAGCSMGAYHAANIAFRYPHFFNKVVCLSGRYDLTNNIQYFKDLFDKFHNQDIYLNMPQQYLANMQEGDVLNSIRQMDLTLAIGETDPFIDDNRYLNKLLMKKRIPHHFYIWNGYAHQPKYWRQMVKLYL